MLAVMIALLATAIALFVVFMGLRNQGKASERREGGDGGGTSASDPDSHRTNGSDPDGGADGGSNAGDSGGGDGGGGGD